MKSKFLTFAAMTLASFAAHAQSSYEQRNNPGSSTARLFSGRNCSAGEADESIAKKYAEESAGEYCGFQNFKRVTDWQIYGAGGGHGVVCIKAVAEFICL